MDESGRRAGRCPLPVFLGPGAAARPGLSLPDRAKRRCCWSQCVFNAAALPPRESRPEPPWAADLVRTQLCRLVFIDFLFTVPSHLWQWLCSPHPGRYCASLKNRGHGAAAHCGPVPQRSCKDKGICVSDQGRAGQRESIRKVPGELNTKKDAHTPRWPQPSPRPCLRQGQGGDGLPKG